MIIRLSDLAKGQYQQVSASLQKATDKQFLFLMSDVRHPSLHAKKYDEATGLWQARINKSWRFYFFIRGNAYYVVSIRKHPK